MSHATQATHPFVLLKQREADGCLALAHEGLREWKAGWCPTAALDVDCMPACDAKVAQTEGQWSAYGMTPESAIWCFRAKDFAKQIERMVFDLDHVSRNNEGRATSDIAERIAAEAADALAASLLRRLSATAAIRQPHADAPPAWQFRRSAGAAWLRIGNGGDSLCMLVPHGLLPARAKPARQAAREPLTPLATALTGITAQLSAELGQVEMSLGQLRSLALGDVITLPVGIDQPLKLFAGKRRLVGLAHLGQQDGYRAVEVFAANKE